MYRRWQVKFDENGGEYTGYVIITATRVYRAEYPNHERVIYADGMKIEFDEAVIDIQPLD